jgi:hypothetical protein
MALRKRLTELIRQRELARLDDEAATLKPSPVILTPQDQAKIEEERKKQAPKAETEAKRRAAQPHSGKPVPATSLRDPMTGLPLLYLQPGKAPPGPPPVQGFDDAVPLRPRSAEPYVEEYGPARPRPRQDDVAPAKPLEKVKQKAAEAGAALDRLGDKAVAPTVDIARLEKALQAARALEAALHRIASMKISPQVGVSRQLARLGDSTGSLYDTA